MSLSQNKADLFGGKKTCASSSTASKTASSTSSTTSAPAPKPAPAPVAAPVSRTAGANLMSGTTSAVDMKMQQKKVEEAQEHSKRGMEYLKTNMFQWKPDHLAAAPCFESSAECYKLADQIDSACGMMVKSAESHEAYGSFAASALALMKAAALAKQGGDRKKSLTLTLKAAQHWGIHGDLQRYADTLGAAGKEAEDLDPVKALEHYRKAIEVVCPESMSAGNMSQLHPSTLDIFRNASAFCVRSKRFKEALALYKRLVVVYQAFGTESSMCKAMLSITILQLKLGDAVQAQQTYLQEHLNNPQYLASKESEAADLFILAFNNQDIEQLEQAQRHVQVNYLDVEVRGVAKGLSLLSYEEVESSAGNSNSSGAATVEKSSLFASKPKAASAPAAPPAVVVAVAPVAKASAADQEEEEEADDGAVEDVNIDDIVIEDDDDEEEENYNNNKYTKDNNEEEQEEEEVGNKKGAAAAADNQQRDGEEEDEELDLS